MTRQLVAAGCVGVALGCVLAVAGSRWGHHPVTSAGGRGAPQPTVVFHQKMIEGLFSTLDLDDPAAVFRSVFSALEDHVVVYPTENYYYFQIYAGGKTIWGNLRLDAHDRDQGIIHLGYSEFDENGQHPDRQRKARTFSTADGVIVKRIQSLIYSVTNTGKTVTFRLNDASQDKPARARLRDQETFVGPIFDDSGLKFFLVFNDQEKYFLYVLNEETPIAETFVALEEGVVIGRRTGLAFLADTKNDRKLLIGAHRHSVDRNNYYDGPFDQLPDNHVDHSNMAEHIEQAYPYTKGQIDRFGNYRLRAGSRALIFPYTVYDRQEELIGIVRSCRDSHLPEDKFHACITRDAQNFHEL